MECPFPSIPGGIARVGLAILFLGCAGAWAQSPGGLGGGSVSGGSPGAQMNEAESRALLMLGRQGGNLLPKDAMADCDGGYAHVGKVKEREFTKVPSSLLDEMKEREETNTYVNGNVYSFGCAQTGR